MVALVAWATIWPKSPGVSIGLLALAAAIMSIRPKMHHPEKAIWLLCLVAFTILEVAAIGRADHEHLEDRKAQDQLFLQLQRAQNKEYIGTIEATEKSNRQAIKDLRELIEYQRKEIARSEVLNDQSKFLLEEDIARSEVLKEDLRTLSELELLLQQKIDAKSPAGPIR